MSTFTEESTNTVPTTPPSVDNNKEAVAPRAIVAGLDSNTAWGSYLNSLNVKYQERIRKMAQVSNYTLTLEYEDGRSEKQVFIRKKLLQWQFDLIEDLRAEATELGAKGEARKAQKALTSMYLQASSFILFNTKKEKMMTEDEYKHCAVQDLRPALDSAMLITLIPDPN